jgi:trehalose synthase
MIELSSLTEVGLQPADPSRFFSLLGTPGSPEVTEPDARAHRELAGRTVWNLNSTAQGGGVAEMLSALLPTVLGAGIDTRWLVLHAEPAFFQFTKRLHHLLHAGPGAPVPALEDERHGYEAAVAPAAEELGQCVRAGDVLIVHDPQPAGLVPVAKRLGAHVIWRCHVGTDDPGDATREAWRFLLPYVSAADAVVFSRSAFMWDGIDRARVSVVHPSLDPFAVKNQELDAVATQAILRAIGLAGAGEGPEHARYQASDGTWQVIRNQAEVLQDDVVPVEAPMVVQVSRWDPLKDPLGVMEGFVRHVPPELGAHLVLAGPAVSAVSDDPEGLIVLQQVQAAWHALEPALQARVHVVSLPMVDAEENAAMVNALQRRAAVVVQKSLEEGFGLTVAEAMWKARPVVASRRGGIQDQIEHGVSGLLLDDPRDLAAYGQAVSLLLADRVAAERIGAAARERVRDRFLAPQHLVRWLDVIGGVIE